jgi:hypothetical protein
MNNFKNELKYQWRMLKANIKGGYQEVKRILVYKDLVEKFKEGLRVIKEDNEYEKQQKMYHKKEILQPNDIVEFRDPNCLGNIIKGRVIDVRYEFVMGDVEIQLEVLENCLRNRRDIMFVYQHHILNNLINIEQPNINK